MSRPLFNHKEHSERLISCCRGNGWRSEVTKGTAHSHRLCKQQGALQRPVSSRSPAENGRLCKHLVPSAGAMSSRQLGSWLLGYSGHSLLWLAWTAAQPFLTQIPVPRAPSLVPRSPWSPWASRSLGWLWSWPSCPVPALLSPGCLSSQSSPGGTTTLLSSCSASVQRPDGQQRARDRTSHRDVLRKRDLSHLLPPHLSLLMRHGSHCPTH